MKKIIFIFFFSALFVGIKAQTPWYLTGNGSTDTTLNFIGTTDKKPLIFKTRDTERMKLLSDRSFLGIGVTNPQATLHLHYQTDPLPVPPLKLLQLTTPVTGFGPNNGFSITYENNKDIRFKQQESAKFFIEGQNGGMVIAQDGKIGVGTDAPQATLHVHNPQTNGRQIPLVQLTTETTGNAARNGFAAFSDYTTKDIIFKQRLQTIVCL